MRRFSNLVKDERGATAVEYGLILALVFLTMIVGVHNFASEAGELWNYVSSEMRNA